MKITYAVALSGILSLAYGVSLNTEDQITSDLTTVLAQVNTETETRGRTRAKASTRTKSGSKPKSQPKTPSKGKIIEAPIVEEVCEPGVQCTWGAYSAPVWGNSFGSISFTRAPTPVAAPEPIFYEE